MHPSLIKQSLPKHRKRPLFKIVGILNHIDILEARAHGRILRNLVESVQPRHITLQPVWHGLHLYLGLTLQHILQVFELFSRPVNVDGVNWFWLVVSVSDSDRIQAQCLLDLVKCSHELRMRFSLVHMVN